jgi:CelD/BcsL family acetyltransferase involved in cellulose biosynthesis
MQPGFELITDMAEASLATMWQDLESRSDAAFFLSWNWIGCWLRETGGSPDVLVGRADGQVVLLGLMVRRRRRDVLPFGIRGVHLNATGQPDTDIITIEYNGFLIDRDCRAEIATEAVEFLLGEGQNCDELHLKSVPLPYGDALRHPALVYRELARKPSYRIDLDAARATKGGYMASLSTNTRQKLRQSLRHYEQQGALELHRAADVPEALAFLDALGTLHQTTWKGRGESGAFAYPFFVRFHRALIAACLPGGFVEVVRVSCGGAPIGYLYNFLYRRHVLFYLSGFLYPEDPRLRPGLVTHLMCIEQHLRDGAAVYDFMEGEARYKASLGRSGPESVYLLVQRATWSIRLENALRGLKRQLKRVRSRRTEPSRPQD